MPRSSAPPRRAPWRAGTSVRSRPAPRAPTPPRTAPPRPRRGVAAHLGAAGARAVAGWYERALAACAADPEADWQAAPLLTPAELHQLALEHNDTAAAYPREAGLAALFSAQAARSGDAPAGRVADGRLRYAALE